MKILNKLAVLILGACLAPEVQDEVSIKLSQLATEDAEFKTALEQMAAKPNGAAKLDAISKLGIFIGRINPLQSSESFAKEVRDCILDSEALLQQAKSYVAGLKQKSQTDELRLALASQALAIASEQGLSDLQDRQERSEQQDNEISQNIDQRLNHVREQQASYPEIKERFELLQITEPAELRVQLQAEQERSAQTSQEIADIKQIHRLSTAQSLQELNTNSDIIAQQEQLMQARIETEKAMLQNGISEHLLRSLGKGKNDLIPFAEELIAILEG